MAKASKKGKADKATKGGKGKGKGGKGGKSAKPAKTPKAQYERPVREKQAKVEKPSKADRPAPTGPLPTPRLRERYDKEIRPALAEHFGRKNAFSLPKIEKIVISMGVSSAVTDKKLMEEAVSALGEIAGQKPARCRARKSIASFRVREGMDVGAKVTLRGRRMYEFLDRLISMALPRVRDFRGLSPNAFDGKGNYSLGLNEQLVFPELNPDKYTRVQGMNIAICCSGGSNDESRELLRRFGFPFQREDTAA